MRVMRVLIRIYFLLALTLVSLSVNAQDAPQTKDAPLPKVEVTFSEAKGIGAEEDVMRRDPSDVIKVANQFYVWYTKGAESGGYNGTVWYATSPDGHNWTEKGEAVARGEKGSWDGQSAFTPNILVAEGRYWLFYTGVSFYPQKKKGPDSKIGIAVADSPDGPWEKLGANPVLTNSKDKDQFDSHLVDDACLIVRDGKYWFYYKGRQLGKSPKFTQMGLAIADKPEGPYVKVKNNPVIPGNHEVLVWPQGTGVGAMIGTTGPKAIARSLMYSEDGLTFTRTHDVADSPHAPGAYRADAFTDSGKGERIEWGVEIGQKGKKSLPFIQRFDLTPQKGAKAEPNVGGSASTDATSSRPQFSWDHVPLYMHVRKSKGFTPKELNYLAGFPLITLEKTTGSKTHGSSEAGARAAAKAIKELNPDTRILYYRNVICNYSSYDVNSDLNDIPGAFLEGKNGKTKLHQGQRELYDLSNPALRKWWLDHCIEMAGHDEIDGLFLDGNIKALSPGYVLREIGADKKQKVTDGYDLMMKELKDRVPENKLLVANIIRARLSDSGLSYLKYFDGSYLEGIETPAGGLSRVEYLAKGIAAIQKAAREGKIICMSMGLGEEALSGLKIDDTRKKLADGANIQSRLDYCLALFLICAEKHSYFLPHDGYSVNGKDSSVWLKRFPEFDKPLGPPQGPAVQDGYTYTREFESARVFLDIEKKEAKITWR